MRAQEMPFHSLWGMGMVIVVHNALHGNGNQGLPRRELRVKMRERDGARGFAESKGRANDDACA